MLLKKCYDKMLWYNVRKTYQFNSVDYKNHNKDTLHGIPGLNPEQKHPSLLVAWYNLVYI